VAHLDLDANATEPLRPASREAVVAALGLHNPSSVHAGGREAEAVRARAVQVVGEQGVIDAIGICGYYAMLAMVLNVENTAK